MHLCRRRCYLSYVFGALLESRFNCVLINIWDFSELLCKRKLIARLESARCLPNRRLQRNTIAQVTFLDAIHCRVYALVALSSPIFLPRRSK